MFRASYFLPILPGFRKYRDYAVGRTTNRWKQGSPHKDLFYHLVGFFVFADPFNAHVLNLYRSTRMVYLSKSRLY